MEIKARGGVADLDELNRLFGAWVEQVYHRCAARRLVVSPAQPG